MSVIDVRMKGRILVIDVKIQTGKNRNLQEITFRLTNVIPERIIFVSRGITVLCKIVKSFGYVNLTPAEDSAKFRR